MKELIDKSIKNEEEKWVILHNEKV